MLVNCRKQPDGSTALEVNGEDIKNYNDFQYWQAVRFWKDYKKFGVPGDWRRLTPQQKALIELYDELAEMRVNHGRDR